MPKIIPLDPDQLLFLMLDCSNALNNTFKQDSGMRDLVNYEFVTQDDLDLNLQLDDEAEVLHESEQFKVVTSPNWEHHLVAKLN